MAREIRTNDRFTESDVRTIVALAAAEGIELSQPDFQVEATGTTVTVEHLPAVRWLMKNFDFR